MSTNKLIAIPFQYRTSHPQFQAFEDLLVFGLLSELDLFSDIQNRTLAGSNDNSPIDPTLPADEVMKKLGQICQSTRSQYLLTGTIQPLMDAQQVMAGLNVVIQLYSLQQNVYVVQEQLQLKGQNLLTPNGSITIPVQSFNNLLNQAALALLKVLPAHEGSEIAERIQQCQLTRSMEALHLAYKAQALVTDNEKFKQYEAALKLDPDMELAYSQMAKLCRAQNEYEKSVVFYRKALEVSQGSNRTRAMYATDAGVGCAVIGKADLALQWWRTAAEIDPTYINPFFNLANMLEDQNNLEEAEKYFLKAQALAPNDFRTFFNLARLYSKMGAWEKALSQYQKQLASEDADPWCHSDVAMCYLNLGDMNRAKEHLEQTVSMDPEGEAGDYAKLILGGIA